MRKRSKYRPKQKLQDPLSYVLNGFARVDDAAKDIISTVRIRNHMAMAVILKGTGTRKEVGDIMTAFRVMRCLADRGLGEDWLPEIKAACSAVESMRLRGEAKGDKFLFTGEELKAINLGMDIHDAQLERCNLAQMEKAVDDFKKGNWNDTTQN